MDYLWTPWRYQYVTKSGETKACVFCEAPRLPDAESLIVHRGTHCFVILNRFPYTSGHLMVIPYQHASALEELPDETLVEWIRLARESEKHLRGLYHPEGLNLGVNVGRSAGAGVAGHIHMHVMPRWSGDTSFITTVAETRILPETLEETWRRLSEAFRSK
jgi:ATP adenylyltransferase